jgi:hypothetical protein
MDRRGLDGLVEVDLAPTDQKPNASPPWTTGFTSTTITDTTPR